MKKRLLKDCLLYVIIDSQTIKGRNYLRIAEDAIRGGADMLQLRCKDLSAECFFKMAKRLRGVASRCGVPFIINDRVDIAEAVGADGVHLGQDDFPIEPARALLGSNRIIGLSTHSLKDIASAAKKDVDYISFGPVFKTPTKPEYKDTGVSAIPKISKLVNVPFFVIGGINYNNIRVVLNSNAKRVAVVRSVVNAKSPYAAAKGLKKALLDTKDVCPPKADPPTAEETNYEIR